MTPMQQQANNVLNAIDEGRVEAVMMLYDKGLLTVGGESHKRRYEIRKILIEDLKFESANADYWLNWWLM